MPTQHHPNHLLLYCHIHVSETKTRNGEVMWNSGGKHWIKGKNQAFQIHLLSLQHTVWSQARELTSLDWVRVSSQNEELD